jgi:hypothetical protein
MPNYLLQLLQVVQVVREREPLCRAARRNGDGHAAKVVHLHVLADSGLLKQPLFNSVSYSIEGATGFFFYTAICVCETARSLHSQVCTESLTSYGGICLDYIIHIF